MTEQMPEGEDLEDIQNRVENEGFDYAMVHFCHWKHIKDHLYHVKLEQFLLSRKNLIDYLRLPPHI